MNLSILYRGPLASCNYGCGYCPFAKHAETGAEHRDDADKLSRFVEWAEGQGGKHRLSFLFTPWGEALIHRRYQRALARLSKMGHVDKVSIQTNLSCRLDWVEDCDKDKVALWATYHPGEVAHAQFVEQCAELEARGVAFSVGVVGMQEHFEAIRAMREALPEGVYLWINAYKRMPGYYSGEDLQRLAEIDPLVPVNNVRHASKGKACNTGERVFSVDGDGVMRRCHFVREAIGNIYETDWERALKPRACTNETCGCHIGYIHMPHLGLYEVFHERLLERIVDINLLQREKRKKPLQ